MKAARTGPSGNQQLWRCCRQAGAAGAGGGAGGAAAALAARLARPLAVRARRRAAARRALRVHATRAAPLSVSSLHPLTARCCFPNTLHAMSTNKPKKRSVPFTWYTVMTTATPPHYLCDFKNWLGKLYLIVRSVKPRSNKCRIKSTKSRFA